MTIFVDVLKNLDLLGSVFAITTDNASNMLRMVEKVEEIIRQSGHFYAQACVYWMFCIGHVLNLTVQEILKAGIGIGPADHIVDMGIDSSRGKPANKLRQGVVWIRSSPQKEELISPSPSNGTVRLLKPAKKWTARRKTTTSSSD